MNAHILVVEDDEDLRVVLADNLEDEGHRVTAVATVAAAARALGLPPDGGAGPATAVAEPPEPVDLVVLDVMLPDGDGYTLCRQYRAARGPAPVLMLTARRLEDDLITGLEAGADDYLAKPYRLRELLARVKALLRRGGPLGHATGPGAPAPGAAAPGAPTEAGPAFGPYRLDLRARLVRGPAGPVALTRTEYDLLAWLVQHTGVAHSRDALLDGVWGADVVVDPRTVDNFVMNLKRKLDWTPECAWRIAAVRGVGYRFEVDA